MNKLIFEMYKLNLEKNTKDLANMKKIVLCQQELIFLFIYLFIFGAVTCGLMRVKWNKVI